MYLYLYCSFLSVYTGVKNPMNYRLGYAKYIDDVEQSSIIVATPGPTTPMIGDLPYVPFCLLCSLLIAHFLSLYILHHGFL